MLDPALFVNSFLKTSQDVQDVITMKSGVARVTAKSLLLDADLKPINLVNPINPDEQNDISAYMEAITVTMNTASDVHRSCTFQLAELGDIGLNTLKQRIKVFIEYRNENDQVILSVPVGVFRFTYPTRAIQDPMNVWTIAGDGLTAQLTQKAFLRTFTFPSTVPVTDGVAAMLRADYIPISRGGRTSGGGSWPFANDPPLTPAGCDYLGPNIPASRISIPPSPLTLGQPLSWDWKTQPLPAIKAALTAINYWPLYDDQDGTITTMPVPFQYVDADGKVVLPGAEWVYTTDEESIINGAIQQKLNPQSQLANVVHVVSNPNNGPPIDVVMYNWFGSSNPDDVGDSNSAISVPNYGDTAVLTVQDDQIPDIATAKVRALLELMQAASAMEEISFETHINPLHGVHGAIGLNVIAKDGTIEVAPIPYPFLETQWVHDVGKRSTTHTVTKLISL